VLNTNLVDANKLNNNITTQFKERLNVNSHFTKILSKVDSYTDVNKQENSNLQFSVKELNDTVKTINSTFQSFYNSVTLLNQSVNQYSHHAN